MSYFGAGQFKIFTLLSVGGWVGFKAKYVIGYIFVMAAMPFLCRGLQKGIAENGKLGRKYTDVPFFSLSINKFAFLYYYTATLFCYFYLVVTLQNVIFFFSPCCYKLGVNHLINLKSIQTILSHAL